MSFRLVIDGNAVYEIDEDCEKCRIEEEKRKQGKCPKCNEDSREEKRKESS